MRNVTYSMGISLDGYMVGPDGGFDWTAPDEDVFRFVTDEIRGVERSLEQDGVMRLPDRLMRRAGRGDEHLLR
jgi:hypothetical protein